MLFLRSKTGLFVIFGLAGIITFIFLSGCSTKPYSLVIKNGLIVDGTGHRAFEADIAVRGDRIIKVGRLDRVKAAEVIEAKGLIVCPGFIDVHTHGDRGLLEVPSAANYILQGVTTIIGGNCGSHPFPLQELFSQAEEKGIAINFGCLVGHNTLREKVMGLRMDSPSPEELAEMKRLLEEEMKAGALGFSTGLAYLPGTYSKTDEIVELAKVAARFGGVYASHIRDQGQKITEAIEEALTVGRQARLSVQISHLKLADEVVWNQLTKITQPIEKAQKEGIRVFCDLYPYTATSSGFTSSFPSWCFEGGKERFLERLNDPNIYRQIKDYIIERRLRSPRGLNRLQAILIARCQPHPEYEGKNLEQILAMKGIKPSEDTAADLIIEIQKEGGAQGIFFQMDEADVAELMKLPYVMIGSDGEIQVFGRGSPHPRSYGTFPRVIGRYVRERKALTLERAIQKMTSLPAEAFYLKDRGVLKPGKFADIVVFDADKFQDESTFDRPHQYPSGLFLVMVNGQVVVRDGGIQPLFPGKIIKGQGVLARGKS